MDAGVFLVEPDAGFYDIMDGVLSHYTSCPAFY